METRFNDSLYDDITIEELAGYYKVSRPVILLKLVNRGVFTSEDYRQKTAQWTEEYESRLEGRVGGESSGGGNYYNTYAVYLGYRFMELAFSRYHQGQCSIEELAEKSSGSNLNIIKGQKDFCTYTYLATEMEDCQEILLEEISWQSGCGERH